MLDVLHVIPFLWSGAGRVLTDLCLMQAGSLRVGLVTAGRSNGQRDWPDYRRALAAAGISHERIDFFDRAPGTFWSGTRALASLIDCERPAIVHTHAGVPAAAAAVVRSMASRRFRTVAQFYSWGLDRPDWMNEMDLWGFRMADRVVCSAEAYRRRLVAGGVPRGKIAMVPWGVTFTEAPRADVERGGGVRLGFVGRIEPRKGQLQLVRVADRLRRWWPDIRLELVGPTADASYERDIREAIAGAGLERQVSLLGKVADPRARMAEWDLFVSLSSDEGQGMAVLEAMELGTPVAALAVAGIEDFVTKESNAFALRPDLTVHQLARHLHAVLSDRDRLSRVGRRGREFVHRHYGWSRTCARLLAAYRLSSSGRSC